MKFITSIAACRRLPLACVLLCTLGLASCGGGGGGATTTTTSETPPTVLDGFFRMMPDLSFLWTTSQQWKVTIVLSRASQVPLGDLRVLLSDYICDDPTGNGGVLLNPVRINAFLSYPLTVLSSNPLTIPPSVDEQGATSVTLNLSVLHIPASKKYVLLEVFDDSLGIALYGKLVEPASLAGLTISLPGPDAPVVASCANPG